MIEFPGNGGEPTKKWASAHMTKVSSAATADKAGVWFAFSSQSSWRLAHVQLWRRALLLASSAVSSGEASWKDRGGIPGGKFQHLDDLFAREAELLDDFLDSGYGFEVFEHSSGGHPGIAKHPCAA
jgi:hypothetical protein